MGREGDVRREKDLLENELQTKIASEIMCSRAGHRREENRTSVGGFKVRTVVRRTENLTRSLGLDNRA